MISNLQINIHAATLSVSKVGKGDLHTGSFFLKLICTTDWFLRNKKPIIHNTTRRVQKI